MWDIAAGYRADAELREESLMPGDLVLMVDDRTCVLE